MMRVAQMHPLHKFTNALGFFFLFLHATLISYLTIHTLSYPGQVFAYRQLQLSA